MYHPNSNLQIIVLIIYPASMFSHEPGTSFDEDGGWFFGNVDVPSWD